MLEGRLHSHELVKKGVNPKTYMNFQKYWVKAHANDQTVIQLSCGCPCGHPIVMWMSRQLSTYSVLGQNGYWKQSGCPPRQPFTLKSDFWLLEAMWMPTWMTT